MAAEAKSAAAAEYRRLTDAARLSAKQEGNLLDGQNLERTLEWKEREQPTVAWAKRYGGRCRQAMVFLERSRRRADELREQRRREQVEREEARERELATAKALAAEQQRSADMFRQREEAKERALSTANALAEQQTRSARTLRGWLVVLAALVVVAMGLASLAWKKGNEATDNAVLAERAAAQASKNEHKAEKSAQLALKREQTAKAEREAAETAKKSALESRAKWFMEVADNDKDADPGKSLLLALEANRAAPQLRATETRLRAVLDGLNGEALTGHRDSVNAVSVSPDGRWLAGQRLV